VAEILLRGGADPSVRTNDGETALDVARRNQHQAVVSLLEGWPAVMTLRTLCQRAIIRQHVDWRPLLPPILMEPIDEVAEHRIYQEIEEEQAGARQQRKRKREESGGGMDKRQR